MSNQDLMFLIVGSIIIAFMVLLILITKNILQNRQIYSFRSDDSVWDHWKSQVFGLILFVSGFIAFTVLFFSYIFITHPEYFGLGLTLIILIQDPLENAIFIIFSFTGLVAATFGMVISIRAVGKFINNIKDSKGERT